MKKLNPLKPYLVSIAAITLAGMAKVAINDIFYQTSSLYLLFFSAVAVSAWYGGSIQGVFSYLYSLFFAYMFLHEGANFSITDPISLVRLGMYTIDCFIVALLSTELRKSKHLIKTKDEALSESFLKIQNSSKETDRVKEAVLVKAEKTADQLAFLSEASAILSETLDSATMLNSLGNIVISNYLADAFFVHYIDEEGVVSRPLLKVRDPEKLPYYEQWRNLYPLENNTALGVMNVLKTGKSELYEEIPDELLRKVMTPIENYLYLKKHIGFRSAMIVPLKYYGRVIGSLTFTYSETNRNYEEMDLSLAQDLAKRATLAIENSRLYTKAQQANRAKSAFLANMSHEIRTPLGAMLGFAEVMLDEQNLSEEQRNYANIIVKNGWQLLRIVDEILDLSKVESESIKIEKIQFSLPKLIEDITSLLNLKATEKSLKLVVESSPDIPKNIISDPTRIRQVLLNTIGNAIKFTNDGVLKVSISIHPSTVENKKILEFKIKDSGIGISPEQQDKLFQPFSQADSSMNRRFGGTGLGLFLSKKLAKLLGGDLVLSESIVGKGSTFVFTTEVECVNSDKDVDSLINQIGPSVSIFSRNETKKKNDRILIVDDQPDNRSLISHFLQPFGFETDTAESGTEAINKALASPYKIIFMDLQMPQMSGFETVKILRAQNYRGPIIALTAHAMKGDREYCLSNGFDEYLCKPVDKELLNKLINQYTNKRKAL